MLTGLASVGFPGTLGYVAAELLVDGAGGGEPGGRGGGGGGRGAQRDRGGAGVLPTVHRDPARLDGVADPHVPGAGRGADAGGADPRRPAAPAAEHRVAAPGGRGDPEGPQGE